VGFVPKGVVCTTQLHDKQLARLVGSEIKAGVAQSAERLTRNEQVRGSIPLPGSTKPQVRVGKHPFDTR
jgi:hypothetical protein